MDLLSEFIEAWRYTRDGVIAEVENLPEAKFEKRPDGLGRSALDLANHVIESGRLLRELTRADGDFQRKPYPELIAELMMPGDVTTSKSEALERLRSSFTEGVGELQVAGLDRLMQPIRQFNGEMATRLVWLHHGLAHEEYHRGQIALFARLLGETPALTKSMGG
jgi:uncharacterized damage-inducible protein DinB